MTRRPDPGRYIGIGEQTAQMRLDDWDPTSMPPRWRPPKTASDTASRTNPRSKPMMVDPNRTKIRKTSAPVNLYSPALRAYCANRRHSTGASGVPP